MTAALAIKRADAPPFEVVQGLELLACSPLWPIGTDEWAEPPPK